MKQYKIKVWDRVTVVLFLVCCLAATGWGVYTWLTITEW